MMKMEVMMDVMRSMVEHAMHIVRRCPRWLVTLPISSYPITHFFCSVIDYFRSH